MRNGNIHEILEEGRCIQNHLPNSRKLLGKTAYAKAFQKLRSARKIKKSIENVIILPIRWNS